VPCDALIECGSFRHGIGKMPFFINFHVIYTFF
jgi:hypothetical protein